MPQRPVLPRAGPDIHQVNVAARKDRRARCRAIAIGQWIPRAAQHNSKRVGLKQVVAGRREGLRNHSPEHRILHHRYVNHPPGDRGKRRNRGGG
jgi:hypothetical protein